MKNGYYLSTYLSPPGTSWLLGVWPRHDNNLSLWRKSGDEIELVRHWELERYSGLRQHGAAFATVEDAFRFIDDLLMREGVKRRDLVEIWGTPGLETTRDHGIQGTGVPWHGIAHLFSSLLLDVEQFYTGRMLAFSVDGVPDFIVERTDYFYAGALAEAGTCTFFPIESPGRIYDTAREYFGLRAGSLMALATASCAYAEVDAHECLEGLHFWGNARVCPNGLGAVAAADLLYTRVTRRVSAWLKSAPSHAWDSRFSERENYMSMVMKVLQSACLIIMERTVEAALRRFSLQPDDCYLSLSGGFGLNLPSNTHLCQKYGFRGFLGPPFINDSGQSIGLALATFVRRSRGQRLNFRFQGAYLGPASTSKEFERAFTDYAPWIESLHEWDAACFVRDVEAGPVVWFDGGSEAGPRALGHRSLLADPRVDKSKTTLNRIKQRQWWRPVAPIVLEEALGDWFEEPVRSPYMLQAFSFLSGRERQVPAIHHLDGTARVQSLRRSENELLYDGIVAFAAHTGVPMLANTSLNDRGEPIINLPAEALNFAVRKGVEVAYFCGRRVALRSAGHLLQEEKPLRRQTAHFEMPTLMRHAEVSAAINPHGVPPVELYYYMTNPELSGRVALTEPCVLPCIRKAMAGQGPYRESLARYLARVWQLYRAPCQDFSRHEWASVICYPLDEIRLVRPF